MTQVDWFSQDLADEADECGSDDEKRERLLLAVATAVAWIAQNPAQGSPEIGIKCNIKGLRHKEVDPGGDFDYLAFYVIDADGVARMSRLVWQSSNFIWKIRVAEGTSQ